MRAALQWWVGRVWVAAVEQAQAVVVGGCKRLWDGTPTRGGERKPTNMSALELLHLVHESDQESLHGGVL